MDRAKLKRLRRKIDEMRQRSSNIRTSELVSLAEALGRVASKRGKEPTYISVLLTNSKPISIPNHPGSLWRYTAENILDALEQDLFNLEEFLE